MAQPSDDHIQTAEIVIQNLALWESGMLQELAQQIQAGLELSGFRDYLLIQGRPGFSRRLSNKKES